MHSRLHDLVLRADRPADEADLRRLAALDSARPLGGRALVAEVEGRPVAALDLADGRVVADPFEHTAEVVELLRVRAQRLHAAARSERRFARRHRLRPAA